MNELYRTLRPMNIGDILDRAVALYRGNFLKFIGVILPGEVLIVIIRLVVLNLFESPAISLFTESRASQYANNYPVVILTYFIETIVIAAGTIMISERFLAREISITGSYRSVLARIFPLIGAVVVSTVIIGVGLLLCAIPGLIFMVWYGLISQVVMIEGEGGLGALKRSKHLVAGYFLKAFGIIVLVWVAKILFVEIFDIVGVLIANATKMEFLKTTGYFLSTLASILIEPFKIAAITLLYYDLRIRKEGFDLEIMAQELAQIEDESNIIL